MKNELVSAYSYALIVISFIVIFCIGLVSCTDPGSNSERIAEKARRDQVWCQTYCEAQGSVLIEIRGQANVYPVCVCVMAEPPCNGEAGSCELEWD